MGKCFSLAWKLRLRHCQRELTRLQGDCEDEMGQTLTRALWYTAPWKAELREEALAAPLSGEVIVRSLYSGVSRGTERLVLSGEVGVSERERMRCPMQAGDFPFPVKYGYCAVGLVEQGDAKLLGRTVFVLHPHQDVFIAPAAMAYSVPKNVPARRAVLAANMETALNALWDSGAAPADRIAIVGGGVVGLLIGFLASKLPGAEVAIVDVCEERRPIAQAMGCRFTAQGGAPSDCDVVFHTSATAEGLATAIGCAGLEAPIVELSWYGGASATPASLGGAFHSQRLKLISSQVGQVSPGHRPRWNHGRRMEAALRLLSAPELDLLAAVEIPFEDAGARVPELLRPGAPGLAPVIRYIKKAE
jgi:NADPH:quinone reductase-like Zn-dependent oxidoreductase